MPMINLLDFSDIIKKDDVNTLRSLESLGLSLNSQDYNGDTLLHYAAQNNCIKLIHYLSLNTKLVNLKNYNGITPLHYAALNGHIKVMKLLINAEADFQATDIFGRDPIYYAQEEGQNIVVEALKKAIKNSKIQFIKNIRLPKKLEAKRLPERPEATPYFHKNASNKHKNTRYMLP